MYPFRDKQKDVTITKSELISFEQKVSDIFETGVIKGPVHLSYNNENYLLDFFQYVNPNDWVFSTWRNHYHALLHGVPQEELMEKIMAGRSISFQSPEHHFYTSAIVNGVVPIAVGAALALKWKNEKDRMVFCFVGDMTSESGTFYEALKYSIRNELPIHFVVENNGLSTNTPTQASWGTKHTYGFQTEIKDQLDNQKFWMGKYLSYFEYTRDKYPHVGIGKWIHF
jgi:TPP-dependent pyruvate/acetoin dehydrogenase alpha subunit